MYLLRNFARAVSLSDCGRIRALAGQIPRLSISPAEWVMTWLQLKYARSRLHGVMATIKQRPKSLLPMGSAIIEQVQNHNAALLTLSDWCCRFVAPAECGLQVKRRKKGKGRVSLCSVFPRALARGMALQKSHARAPTLRFTLSVSVVEATRTTSGLSTSLQGRALVQCRHRAAPHARASIGCVSRQAAPKYSDAARRSQNGVPNEWPI